ncbi:MAG: tetraacyldisaccharide 4'-kinase [Elusimicrobia bacterium RIFCSPLOWO2_01_FULL_59_12]|nr:MAG: tetraacyldisaccharide 4'-kinase [Elusimicrobia bacterium RIFCSPLOWO2_01_FULL_59_12]
MTRRTKIQGTSLPWWEEVLRGQRQGILAESMRQAARLGSWGYRIGVRGREAAYEKGLLRVRRLPRPTVCVGNITVGGTGKTPLVMRLAADLLAQGCRPAVLLRGYKRVQKTARPVLVRSPKSIFANVQEAGDEAMELAQRLPGACIGVGADRYAAGSMILKQFPVDCFIMDDGFQHYQLHRDLNIVTLDVTDPWGGGRLLPAGLLRESPEALKRADIVILTRTGSVAPDRLSVLRAEVSSLVRDSGSVLESRHEPRCLMSLADAKEIPLSRLKGKQILVVSGIANPQAFESGLEGLGAEITGRFRVRDHGGRPGEVWKWVSRHQWQGQWVVMTEKDAVRWAGESTSRDLLAHAFALRMELVVSSGRDIWQNMIKQLAATVPLG